MKKMLNKLTREAVKLLIFLVLFFAFWTVLGVIQLACNAIWDFIGGGIMFPLCIFAVIGIFLWLAHEETR